MSTPLTKEYFDKVLDKKFQDFEVKLDIKLDKKLNEQLQEYQRYVGAIRESFQDNLQVVAESVSGLYEKVDKIDSRVGNLEADMKEVKFSIASLNYSLRKT